jgi:hypothetical protein
MRDEEFARIMRQGHLPRIAAFEAALASRLLEAALPRLNGE